MFNINKEYEKCWHCENFYGPNFGEPLCMTCHLFLYPNAIEDEMSSASCSRLAPNNATPRSNILMRETTGASQNTAAIATTSTLNDSDAIISPDMSQLRNMIEKQELNDSGNEDSDPDPLNLELISSENETTTANSLLSKTSPLNILNRANATLENEANINLDEENDDEEDEENERSKSRRFRNRRRSNSNSNISYSNSNSNNASGANYYTIQYSRKQLDSLARNAARLNNNNNYHRNNNNNYRQQNVDNKTGKQPLSGRLFSSSSTCSPLKSSSLKQQLILLSIFNEANRCEMTTPDSDYINILPNEVLWNIFRKLDDLSIWSVSRVCKRWHELVRQEINDDEWRMFICNRWIFFRPAVKIRNHQALYSQLVQSSNCFYCLQYIHNRSDSFCSDEVKKSWRHKRLLLELKALHQDPMPGINARPLDASCYYWQASITGPVGSPYEGGIFYLFLKIPPSYPLNPPLVQFVTKIYHPNISKHGDIGLDSIHENWSLALTISKVLISIQSLLTDPYTKVCMEDEIGRVYNTNREMYERNARFFTWKYAMSDYVQFDEYNQINNHFCDQ